MSIASTLARSLLITLTILVAVLIAAPTAQATCEYQGSRQAGTVDCLRWADEESPGTAEQAAGTSGTSVDRDAGDGSTSGTVSAPTCRDSRGDVVPCTTENENGELCYFGSPIGTAPDGSGGGVAYICPPADDDELAADPPSDAPPGDAPADPVVVAWQAVASMDLQAVDMSIVPEPLSVNNASMGLVGLPVWLWTDPTAWEPVTASASDGPVSVTATARVVRVEWDMGDGTTITCTDEHGDSTPGTTFNADIHGVEDHSPDCGHIYEQVLRDRHKRPIPYAVTATSYWVAEWSDDDGESGTIPFDLTASDQVRIGEMHVLRTGRAD